MGEYFNRNYNIFLKLYICIIYIYIYCIYLILVIPMTKIESSLSYIFPQILKRVQGKLFLKKG